MSLSQSSTLLCKSLRAKWTVEQKGHHSFLQLLLKHQNTKQNHKVNNQPCFQSLLLANWNLVQISFCLHVLQLGWNRTGQQLEAFWHWHLPTSPIIPLLIEAEDCKLDRLDVVMLAVQVTIASSKWFSAKLQVDWSK